MLLLGTLAERVGISHKQNFYLPPPNFENPSVFNVETLQRGSTAFRYAEPLLGFEK